MPQPQPDLQIAFTPRRDGSVVFRITRADGSAAWQRHQPPHAAFFPLHDLTHYAVETVLGSRDGFYGLLAAGWDIPDTGGRGARGPLPAEALLVEQLVGLFERERAGGSAVLSADTFHAQLVALVAAGRIPHAPRLGDERLNEVREKRRTLHEHWTACASAGRSLALRYERPALSRLEVRSSLPAGGRGTAATG